MLYYSRQVPATFNFQLSTFNFDMTLENLIASAKQKSASDLHIEAGMPVAFRVRGTLHLSGQPISARNALDMVKKLCNPEQWASFLERRSCDFSKAIEGVRCRINVLQSSREVCPTHDLKPQLAQ